MSTTIGKFEDLLVWQNSVSLTTNIYTIFKGCRDYSFKDQICRASVSIPSNIAEGFERQTNKEYIHFLYIAKESAGEVRTQLVIAKNLKYIDEEIYQGLSNNIKRISAQLFQLIKVRTEKFK